jgi:CheY-like chemotaxis protein
MQESLPCLLLIGINMPIMDGKQMLEKLREPPDYNDMPVILFSTSRSANDKRLPNTTMLNLFQNLIIIVNSNLLLNNL